MNSGKLMARSLNKGCKCTTLDQAQLQKQLERDPLLKGLYQEIVNTRPHLFSSTMVFVGDKELTQMSQLIETIEKVIASRAFQKMALDNSPPVAQKNHGPKGVFMGYDFHIDDDGPKLIEINTNAGGGLLNLELARAQLECCQAQEKYPGSKIALAKMNTDFHEMFLKEWNYQRKDKELKTIAIVDTKPQEQYLYPEFQLFERLFSSFNIQAFIVDPSELKLRDGKLWVTDMAIDLVYNRLTDFYLEEEAHQHLRAAYDSGEVVFTPAPYHHALYANKLNLATMTDETLLAHFNLSDSEKDILLKYIPKTIFMTPKNRDQLWQQRKNLFFKPVSGYGGKATYRGDKITHKVWEQIQAEDYVAQTIVHPTERAVKLDELHADMKFDIRAYVYEGQIQLLAARLYSGQTTNFRTRGGGFAPVFTI